MICYIQVLSLTCTLRIQLFLKEFVSILRLNYR
ncbi:hypothetical protein MXB_2627 [Myxobolus squamalis]|nr:hypothetical protein MXB_2627 [Myxobolus squamalis]